MTKKAVLVISFGTSYKETFESTIKAIEEDFKRAYPNHDHYRAYTSRMIIKKLKERDGIRIDLPAEALEKIKAKGYEEVLCQCTHIINGIEYQMTLNDLRPYSRYINIKVGAPLLTEYEDYIKSIDAVIGSIPPIKEDEALILMGHGTHHHSNSAYPCLDYYFKAQGHTNVYLASVEGFPYIEDVIEAVKNKGGIRKIYLMPFMVVAGDHARNDMLGEDDSWAQMILSHGFEVEGIMKGLGEIEAIRNIFVEHSKKSVTL